MGNVQHELAPISRISLIALIVGCNNKDQDVQLFMCYVTEKVVAAWISDNVKFHSLFQVLFRYVLKHRCLEQRNLNVTKFVNRINKGDHTGEKAHKKNPS